MDSNAANVVEVTRLNAILCTIGNVEGGTDEVVKFATEEFDA